MRKLWRILALLLILGMLLAGGLHAYVQPDHALDLVSSEISIREKLTDMLSRRRLEIVLSEAEVNGLIKKTLAEHADLRPDWTLTGAEFSLEGSQWVADVNMMYKGLWPVGAKMYFIMSWQEPYLTAVHTRTQIREVSIPLNWFQMQPLQIPLNDYLPKPAGIRGVMFQDHAIRIGLKRR
jgi:hypothetical protein